MNIQILPSEVVNQIAAGEVVERPSHLVKELIENSLDAQATRVVVGVDPKTLEIEIEDDGVGMTREDLALSVLPHATSKIRVSEDLWKLGSFGFRGEALASISSVSDFTIRSRPKGAQGSAFQLKMLFGSQAEVNEVPGQSGTRVVVRELFSNLPARKKFLRSAQYELAGIRQAVKALALAHPQVEFVFRVGAERRVEFAYANSSLPRRVQEVFELPQVFEAQGEMAQARVKIIFSDPNTTQKSAKNVWIFVQNRWVQDKGVFAAVMEAYRGLLMHGEFPYAAIFLDLPPGEVDVNIHPTKSQVRFADPKLIFQLVQKTLRAELEKAPWLVTLLGAADQSFKTSSSPAGFFEDFTQSSEKGKNAPPFAGERFPNQSFQARGDLHVFDRFDRSETQISCDFQPQANFLPAPTWANLKLIGQVGRTYLICQKDSGVIFIDQHAAHERVLFERIMSAFNSRPPKIQDFLFPLVVDTSPEQGDWIWRHREQFQKIGLRIEKAGPHQIQVESAPEWLKESSIVEMLEEVSRKGVDHGEQVDFQRYYEPIAASLACHSAIRAGKSLTESEMRSLLAEMDEFPLSSFCPHGRPVFVEYSFAKLERDFGRTV